MRKTTKATILLAVSSLAAFGCTVRSRRPDGPFREAQELADALSDEAVDCTREHAPEGQGQVVFSSDISHPGAAPEVRDAGSSAGSEAILSCIQARAREKLRNPRTAPAPFVRIKLPLPLVTSEITYAFVKEQP